MADLTGDDSLFPASVEVPDDGDDYDAASVSAPLEALLDRTAYLGARRAPATDAIKWLRHAEYQHGTGNNEAYPINSTGSEGGWYCVHTLDDATPGQMSFGVDVPNGVEIKAIRARINPNASVRPVTMPKVKLIRWRHDYAVSATVEALGEISDASGTDPAYAERHQIGGSITPTTIDHELYSYRLIVYGPAGTASSDWVLNGAAVIFDQELWDPKAG